MNSTLFLASLAAALTSAPPEAPHVELRYAGSLVQVGRDGTEANVKQFTVDAWWRRGPQGDRLVHVVDEDGKTAWAWPERFGESEFDADGKPTGKARVRILHEHDKVKSPIEVPVPLFANAAKLAADAEWTDGRQTYAVAGTKTVRGRDCWRVEISSNFGRIETAYVEKGTPLVVRTERRVFLGRGDRFDLVCELESSTPLDDAQAARWKTPAELLLKLRTDLGRSEIEVKPELSERQLASAAAVLPELLRAADGTPFRKLVVALQKDVDSQQKRTSDVSELARTLVGKKLEPFDLTLLDGSKSPAADRAGRILVLHFWEYQGEPLAEPYGQVGYLDFLHNRRRKLGVTVLGVAVDPRFADPAKKTDALRSVRKLTSFMNLGYGVAVDDGTLLRTFGDPRRVGAKLPLWVVLAPDGTVAHYKAGFYDIRPEDGLKPLDEALIPLIREKAEKDKQQP